MMYCISILSLIYLRSVKLDQVPLIINQLPTNPKGKPHGEKGFTDIITLKNSGLAAVVKNCSLVFQAFMQKTSGVFSGPGKPMEV